MTVRARRASTLGGGEVPTTNGAASIRESGIFRRVNGAPGPAQQAPERHHRGSAHAGRGDARAALAKGIPASDPYPRVAEEIDNDLFKVAACSVCVSPTGWVLVEGDHIRFANFAFHRIDGQDGASLAASWRQVPSTSTATSSRSYSHLSALAVGEAKRMGDRRHRLGPTRFERVGCVVEVTVERPPAGLRSDAAVVLVHDITELARAEMIAAEANAKLIELAEVRAADEVSVGIAHDLGNTIGAVLARLSVLERSSDCSASQSSELGAIEQALSSAASLVNRLQSVAHVRDLRLGPLDPREVVTSAIEMAGAVLRAPTDGRGKVEVCTALPLLPKVTGCADELRNVFVNLLLNARDAMPAGGTVYITGRKGVGEVVLQVEDEGTGIPARDLERIFEPFFSTKGPKGTGMGLAIARATLSRCGGSIAARRRPIRGSCLEVRLRVSG
jgi:signal transduction histidine kinase